MARPFGEDARILVVSDADQRPLQGRVGTHRKVAGLAPPLFGNWLDLFEATATELFVAEVADRFARAARRIAESLKLALFFRPDRLWPEDLRHRPAVSRTCA